MTDDTIKRFEEKFIPEPNSGCWIWIAGVNKYGYGHFMLREPKRMVRAHRLAYEIWKGAIPQGLLVRHTCDMRCCVNPDHLVVGTQTQNMQDSLNRGTFIIGERHHAAKLVERDIIAIRDDTRLHEIIAAAYNVSATTVSDIKRRRYWKHIS